MKTIMKTITKQQLEAIVKDIFKTSINSKTTSPIEFGFEYGNPAIYVSTRHSFTDLRRIQGIIYKFGMNDITVTNIAVMQSQKIGNNLCYAITLSPLYEIVE